MIALNIEDNSIKLLDIKKGLFGKLTFVSFSKNDFKKGEQWEEKAPVIKEEVAISVPDSIVHLLRISLPADTSKENISSFLMDQVREKLNMSLDKMIFDSAIVERSDLGIQVIFVGIEFEKLLPFYRAWKRIDLNPVVLTSQALAYFEVLKLTIEENQAAVSVNAEDDNLYLLFYDKNGPVKSKFLTAEFEKMPSKVSEAILEFEKERGHRINRVILGGDQGEDLAPSEIGQDIECVKAREVVEDLIIKNNYKIKDDYTAKGSFLNTIGLGLIFFDDNKFNLIKSNFEQIMQSIKLEEKPEVVEIAKEDNKDDVKKDVPEKSKEEKEVVVASKPGVTDPEQETEREEPVAPLLKQEKKRNVFILPVIIFIITAVVAFSGLYFYQAGAFQKLSSFIPKPTPIPTQAPVPTVKPVTRAELKAEVLNGSGEVGAASTVADALTKKGYKDIKTDNADNYDYTQNILRVKEKFKKFAEAEFSDLNIGKTETLNDNSSFDIVIIVGKKKLL